MSSVRPIARSAAVPFGALPVTRMVPFSRTPTALSNTTSTPAGWTVSDVRSLPCVAMDVARVSPQPGQPFSCSFQSSGSQRDGQFDPSYPRSVALSAVDSMAWPKMRTPEQRMSETRAAFRTPGLFDTASSSPSPFVYSVPPTSFMLRIAPSLLGFFIGGFLASWLVAPASATGSAAISRAEPLRIVKQNLETPDDYLSLIRSRGDRTPPRFFNELADFRTEEALVALRKAADAMKQVPKKRIAYDAMRVFLNDPDLEQKAVDIVRTAALSRTPAAARAAAKTLSKWGEPAEDALFEIAEEGPDEAARATAISGIREELARRGDPASLKILLAGFRVPMSGTHNEGVKLFSAFDTEKDFKLMAHFVSAPKSPVQRSVVVIDAMGELTGNVPPTVDQGADLVLGAAMKSRISTIQYRALVAVALRGGTVHGREVTKLTKSKDEAVRKAALLASLRIGEEGTGAKGIDPFALAKSRDPIARQAATLGLAEAGDDEALAALHVLVADETFPVKAEAIRAIVRVRSRSSIPVLIEGLANATGRLRSDFHEALVELTAKDLGSGAGPWQTFWSKESESFQMPSESSSRTAKRKRSQRDRAKGADSRAAFYGLEVISEGFVLVIDTSGSMAKKVGTGRDTRLDRAKEELVKTIDRVPEGALFNIIAFSDGSKPMSDGLIPMNDKSREEALGYVKLLRQGGGTNIYDSLEVAFDDERVDTIYLLSDGDPSVGDIVDPVALQSEVERWNSVRGVKINSIAVGQDHQLLRGLAKDSDGEYVRVN